MSDGLTVAAILLVAGPAIGVVCLCNRPMLRVWTVPREEHLAIVAAHRFAWTMINVGFTVATILTAAGLALLAGFLDVDEWTRAILIAATVAYVVGGTLWCAVLAIRTRTTPAIAELVAAGTPTEPAETLVGAITWGLYSGFMIIAPMAEIAIGLALAAGGGVAAPIAWLATLAAAGTLVAYLAMGDFLPAAVYPPTLLIGIALLLGWT